MILLNFHTHQLAETESERRIYNLIVPQSEDELETFPEELPTGRFSVGIHPKFISESTIKKQIEAVRILSKHNSVAFIGECGLDRTAETALSLQEQVFIQQIRIAESVSKPIVIHCVRCFNELISIKKVVKPKIPMIIHGFNNRLEIIKPLIERGFYFSLGSALLNQNSNASQIINQIPIEKLFLENDDKDLNIKEIYAAASSLLKIPEADLSNQILENWLEITIS